MDLITTAPTVVYEVVLKSGEKIEVENPSKLPDIGSIETILEPIITATILVPQEYVGNVMTLCNQKRGVQVNMQYMGRQVMLTYDLPMNEVVMEFFVTNINPLRRGVCLRWTTISKSSAV